MTKYCKVMFGTTSGAKRDFEYKIDEVNVANNWNPKVEKGRDFGGFNFSTEDKILRWLHRGDTIYDVTIPEDAEVIDVIHSATPHGVFRSNKIIVSNPRKVTDDMALEFYKKSTIPEMSYYKAMGAVAIMNYEKTALAILKDKVNKDNIDVVLDEWNNFIDHGGDGTRSSSNELVSIIDTYLEEIKSDLLISRFISKEPYIKRLTDDRVINLTGESGSGKSYYSNKYLNDDNYIVIDSDIVFGKEYSDNKESLEIRELFKDKNKEDFINDFDNCYLEILDYFKDSEKTIVIDSAQYRNVKDISILKGEVIVMRTDIETCYQRCLSRWKMEHKGYTEEEYQKYMIRKSAIFNWYHSINEFLKRLDGR